MPLFCRKASGMQGLVHCMGPKRLTIGLLQSRLLDLAHEIGVNQIFISQADSCKVPSAYETKYFFALDQRPHA